MGKLLEELPLLYPGWKPLRGIEYVPDKLKFPLMVSVKYDGLRAFGVRDSQGLPAVATKGHNRFRNRHVHTLFGREELLYMDSELILGDPTRFNVYNETNSAVTSADGEPDVTMYAFDDFRSVSMPFAERYLRLAERIDKLGHPNVKLAQHDTVFSLEDLMQLYETRLAEGHEGLMLRSPDGLYKHGKSTTNEGYMLKMKPYKDIDVEIVGVIQATRNDNEAETNAFGHTARSSAKGSKVPVAAVGSFTCRHPSYPGITFEMGCGIMKHDERRALWKGSEQATFEALPCNHAKMRFLPIGVIDRPRMGRWYGWQHNPDTE